MKSSLGLLLMSILCAPFAFAQQAKPVDSLAFLKPGQAAFYYVRHLSTGALLVSLQERARGIEILRRMGDTSSANLVIRQQYNQNKIIVRAFARYFTYCPVYFFYNTNNDSVLIGHTRGIFLDTNLVVNPSIKLKESFYLVAKEGDTEESAQGIKGDSTDDHPVATQVLRSGGILVMDSRFNLLSSPFPYFTDYGRFKNFWRAVDKLNEKLLNIYSYKKE